MGPPSISVPILNLFGKHIVDGGSLQQIVNNFREYSAQVLLQSGNDFVQENSRVFVDHLVADLSQHGIPVEQIVQVEGSAFHLQPDSNPMEPHVILAVDFLRVTSDASRQSGVSCSEKKD